MWPFRCKHPAAALRVERKATVTPIDADFTSITYHLLCSHCGERVEVQYAEMVGGVEGFLARGHQVRNVDSSRRPRWLGGA